MSQDCTFNFKDSRKFIAPSLEASLQIFLPKLCKNTQKSAFLRCKSVRARKSEDLCFMKGDFVEG